MGYKHVLLEVYCSLDYSKNNDFETPSFCKHGVNNPGYHCFDNECKYKSYTKCPNEFAYVDEFGEVVNEDCYIGFGGEMDSVDDNDITRSKMIELWENICKKKINEAYEEYMLEKNKIINNEDLSIDN